MLRWVRFLRSGAGFVVVVSRAVHSVDFPGARYLHIPFPPAGDQPAAIHELAEGILDGEKYQTLLGVTGSGKTFTMQLLGLRMRMRGIQCYILAPLKGHEFKRACAAGGGTYIKISPGSSRRDNCST